MRDAGKLTGPRLIQRPSARRDHLASEPRRPPPYHDCPGGRHATPDLPATARPRERTL